MQNKRKLIFLFFVFVASFYLRFSNISTNFIFGADQSEDLYKVLEIYNTIKAGEFWNLPIIGEPGTYSTGHDVSEAYPVYSGVFFLYLILPFVAFVGFNPALSVLLFAFTNFLGVFLVYAIGKKILDERSGLIAALLYGTNYYMNVYSRAIWTPSFIPVLVMLALYFFVLIKKDNKIIYWPLFTFTISAMSQIHDSGYYYLGMFVLMVLFIRSKKPTSLLLKTVSILLFLIPMIPTLIYEVKTKFMLFPSIYKELVIQIEKGGSGFSPLMVIQRLWEFAVSTIYPLSFSGYLQTILGLFYWPVLVLITIVLVASIINIFSPNTDRLLKKVYWIFLLSFLFVPIVTKVYYADSYFGLYPLFGSTFSTIGAMPFVFLIVSGTLSHFSRIGTFQTVVTIVFLIYLTAVNIRGVNDAIIMDGDRKYDYGNKVEMVKSIKTDLGDANYHFILNDENSYSQGIEFFYLLHINGLPPPITYNGRSSLVNSFHTYSFTNAESENRYAVSTEAGWVFYEQEGWKKLKESGRYKVYKKVY